MKKLLNVFKITIYVEDYWILNFKLSVALILAINIVPQTYNYVFV